ESLGFPMRSGAPADSSARRNLFKSQRSCRVTSAQAPALISQKAWNRFPGRAWFGDGIGDTTAANTAVRPEPAIAMNKVPQVAIGFWIIKIAATTLGETGGDALSMSLNLGYATSTIIFFVLFAVAVGTQIRARKFHAFLYWAVIVATTLTGTTLADFCDRSLGIGYLGGSIILFALVIATLTTWRLRWGRFPWNASPRR